MAAALRGMRREDRTDDFAVVVLCRNAEVARQNEVPCFAVPLEHDAAQPLSLRYTVRQALEQVAGQSLQILGTGRAGNSNTDVQRHQLCARVADVFLPC